MSYLYWLILVILGVLVRTSLNNVALGQPGLAELKAMAHFPMLAV